MRLKCVECGKDKLIPKYSGSTPVWNCAHCGARRKSEIGTEANRYFTARGEEYEMKLQRVLRTHKAQESDALYQAGLAC